MDEIGESLGNVLGLGVLAVGAGITLKAMNNLVESSNPPKYKARKRVQSKKTLKGIKSPKIKPPRIKLPKDPKIKF